MVLDLKEIPLDKIFPRSYMDFEQKYQKDPGMNRVKMSQGYKTVLTSQFWTLFLVFVFFFGHCHGHGCGQQKITNSKSTELLSGIAKPNLKYVKEILDLVLLLVWQD